MRIFCKIVLLLFAFSACGCSSIESEEADPIKEELVEEKGDPYVAPDFADAVFSLHQASKNGEVILDLSHASEGYIAISAMSDSRLKFRVITEDTYTYDLKSDATVSVFPLQSGNTSYKFVVYEQLENGKYMAIYEESEDVMLLDEFQPYLRPNDYVPYTKDSKCVSLAKEFVKDSYSDLDVIQHVFSFVCNNITYDREKAEIVQTQSGYVPVVDETLQTGKGICFDYASLTASMLRSQGIPVKLIFGYVSSGKQDVYHAWNMVYTKQQGWITAEFEVNSEDWNRVDLTFSANGADSSFIGDGNNYATVYQY